MKTFQIDLDKGSEIDPAYVYGPRKPRTAYPGFETSFQFSSTKELKKQLVKETKND